MRPTTTTALALAGAAMALPAVALAESDDPPTPTETTLAAPFAGHLSVADRLRAERREALVQRLTPRAVRLAGKVARVKGVELSERAERRRLRGESPSDLRAEIRERGRELRRAEQAAASGIAGAGANTTAAPHLEAIAACESGGDPTANTGNGFYGKYQFTQTTWESVGGTGNPAAASEAEQDMRAAMLYAQQGSSPWPVCGG
jgi:Transglycosylase-like domain